MQNRKFGPPPKICPPRAKFPRKFGPPGAIFPRKFGPHFGNLAPLYKHAWFLNLGHYAMTSWFPRRYL